MKSRSCERGMPECAAGLSARRDRKNDVDMMSNCHPSFRAIASAFGTLGDSINPNRSFTLEKVALICSSLTRSAGSIRRWRDIDRKDDVFLVQHLIMLETVHQRRRRAGWIAGQEHSGAGNPLRWPLFQHRDQIEQRKLQLAGFLEQ